jgi:hypothetical protein
MGGIGSGRKPEGKNKKLLHAKLPKKVISGQHKANNKNAAMNIKKSLISEGRKNIRIKKSGSGYLVSEGTKSKKVAGYYKTPSGIKPKSLYTKQENALIKKYRAKGSAKSFTPKQQNVLIGASLKGMDYKNRK